MAVVLRGRAIPASPRAWPAADADRAPGALVVLKADKVLQVIDGERGLDLGLAFGILAGIDPVAEVGRIEAESDEQFRARRRQPEIALQLRIFAAGGYRLPEVLLRDYRLVLSLLVHHCRNQRKSDAKVSINSFSPIPPSPTRDERALLYAFIIHSIEQICSVNWTD